MIGDKIKERRLELGLTQQQVSLATGIKVTTISNYENNISSPSEENIFKFMEVLKCDANYLFEWNETNDFIVTYAEQQSIKKYRALDTHGKIMVDFVLNEEYNRCNFREEDGTSLNISTKEISLPKTHLLVAGKGGFADIEISDPEGLDEEVEKLKRKHNIK